ncbi:MAG: tripartite tricarboxylate transporter substrate-binding protein [Casimicrobiaceae bacterium]
MHAQSVAELIALARANPGKFNYAASSTGSALRRCRDSLRVRVWIWACIPYKGGVQAITDVV